MMVNRSRINATIASILVLIVFSGCTTTYNAGVSFNPAEVLAVPPVAQEMVSTSVRLAIDDAMIKSDFSSRIKGKRVSIRIQGVLSFGYETLLGFIKAEVEGAFAKAGAFVVDDVFVADDTIVLLPPATADSAYDYLVQVDLLACGISQRVEGPKDSVKLGLQIGVIAAGGALAAFSGPWSTFGGPLVCIGGSTACLGGIAWAYFDRADMIENYIYEARTLINIHLLPQDPAGAYVMTGGEGKVLLDSKKAMTAR